MKKIIYMYIEFYVFFIIYICICFLNVISEGLFLILESFLCVVDEICSGCFWNFKSSNESLKVYL